MRLLICINCKDVFNLAVQDKMCACGRCVGRREQGHEDRVNVGGPCRVLGVSSTVLYSQLLSYGPAVQNLLFVMDEPSADIARRAAPGTIRTQVVMREAHQP